MLAVVAKFYVITAFSNYKQMTADIGFASDLAVAKNCAYNGPQPGGALILAHLGHKTSIFHTSATQASG